MKITIDLEEIPVRPEQADLKNNDKATFAANHCFVRFEPKGTIAIYTPDFGVHYRIVINRQGKPSLKEIGTERCYR